VKVFQQDGVDLSLKIAPLSLKQKDWSPYGQKIKKILKEIWETGEAKNYQGLDLNWPANSQSDQNLLHTFCDQCHKHIRNRKLAYFSDVEKDLDFCSESCHSNHKKCDALEEENNKLKEQLKKQTENKTIWMAISIVAVSIFALTLLIYWLKIKKLKKR
jgi:hypothetical protein